VGQEIKETNGPRDGLKWPLERLPRATTVVEVQNVLAKAAAMVEDNEIIRLNVPQRDASSRLETAS